MNTGSVRSILAIPGSLRQHSFNRGLLEAAVESAPAGTSIVLYEDLASIPLFDEDLERTTVTGPEPVRRLRALVAAADGVLFATPEYNQSIPGVLKNAVDWLSRPLPDEVLAGKPVAIIGASGGRWGTRLAQAGLRHVLYATESLVMVKPAMFVREAEPLFDGSGHLKDPGTRKQLERVLHAFGDWIDLVGTAGGNRPDRSRVIPA